MQNVIVKKRQRNPMSQATKDKIREAMKRIGHLPPSQKGLKRSAESRERISLSKKGSTHTLEVRQKMSENRSGEKNHFFGKSHVKSSLIMMSKAKIGKKPPNYIEDRSKVKLDTERGGPLHKEWSKSVKNRDKWKCCMSNGLCEGKVVAHHIYPWSLYPDLRYKINNGITLCRVHHPRKRVDEQSMIPLFTEMVSNIK